jgi:hypothetical protein
MTAPQGTGGGAASPYCSSHREPDVRFTCRAQATIAKGRTNLALRLKSCGGCDDHHTTKRLLVQFSNYRSPPDCDVQTDDQIRPLNVDSGPSRQILTPRGFRARRNERDGDGRRLALVRRRRAVCGRRARYGSKRPGSARGVRIFGRVKGVTALALGSRDDSR